MKKQIKTFVEALEIVPECKKMNLYEVQQYQQELRSVFENETKGDRFLKIKAIQFILENWKYSKKEFKIDLELAHEMKIFGHKVKRWKHWHFFMILFAE